MNRHVLLLMLPLSLTLMLLTCEGQDAVLSALGSKPHAFSSLQDDAPDRTIGTTTLSTEDSPVNTNAFISFTLKQPQPVRLFVYDDNGNTVRKLIDLVLFDSGDHLLFMEGIGMAPGRYLYELRTRSETIRRLVDILPRIIGEENPEPTRLFIKFGVQDFDLKGN